MYDALTVSRYIINFCLQNKAPISNLQLQKILYFVQRECLGKLGYAAFADEIRAWKFGPVVLSAYFEFSSYTSSPIFMSFNDVDINYEIRKIIDKVVAAKMNTPAWKLVEETHKTGTPWYQIYNTEGHNGVIPKDLIEAEYRGMDR